MNIETTKAEIHEMVETMQNESFLNRTHAQLKHFKVPYLPIYLPDTMSYTSNFEMKKTQKQKIKN